jgi:hypothetical protein
LLGDDGWLAPMQVHIADHLQLGVRSALPRVVLGVLELLAVIGKATQPITKVPPSAKRPGANTFGVLDRDVCPSTTRPVPKTSLGRQQLAMNIIVNRIAKRFLVMDELSFKTLQSFHFSRCAASLQKQIEACTSGAIFTNRTNRIICNRLRR